MKRVFFVFVGITCTLTLLRAADNKLKQNDYGLWAANEFVNTIGFMPYIYKQQLLVDKSLELGITQPHFDDQLGEWTLQIGPSVYKANLVRGLCRIRDYKLADGCNSNNAHQEAANAYAKALLEGRVAYFKDGEFLTRAKTEPFISATGRTVEDIRRDTKNITFPIQVKLPTPKGSPKSSVETC
jgi:hypothetical protein